MKNKKGVSVLISYVLLVVIILALAPIVYSFLKSYLPVKTLECEKDTSIAIDQANCTIINNNRIVNLTVTVRNNGLFNISALFVRIGEEKREIKSQVNNNNEILTSPISPDNQPLNLSFTVQNALLNLVSGKEYVVEIQPAVYDKKNEKFVVCEKRALASTICISDSP